MSKKIRNVSSIAVYNKDGKLLFGKRNDTGKWTLPGGHCEEDEAPEKAAVREMIEETGLVPEELTFLGDALAGRNNNVHVYAYKAIARGTPNNKADPDAEIGEFRWVDTKDGVPDEIMRNLYSPKNVTLRLLGLQGGDLTKAEPPRIPAPPHIDAYMRGEPVTFNHSLKSELEKAEPPDVVQHLVHPEAPFEEWLRGSKFVDEHGKPLTFYHGTRSGSMIKELRPSTGGEFGPGIYLSADDGTAHFYAEHVAQGPDGPSILPLHVSLKNPFRVSKTDWIKMTANSTPSTVQSRLIRKGHDGIVGVGLTGQEQIVAFHPHQVRTAIGIKKDELEKVSLTDERTAARMRQNPHQPHGTTAYDRVETYNLPNNMFHHVFYDKPMGTGYQSIMHALSNSPNPLDNAYATSASGLHPAHLVGEWPENSFVNNPWKDQVPAIVHGETASNGPKGWGTILYQQMLKVHGRMTSDSSTSAGANGVWEKLAKDPQFKAGLGYGKGQRHWAEYNGSKPVPSRVYEGDGRPLEIMLNEPENPYTIQLKNFKNKNDTDYIEANAHHKTGGHVGIGGYHIDHDKKRFYGVGPYWTNRGVPGTNHFSWQHHAAAGVAMRAVEKATGYQYGGDLPKELAEPLARDNSLRDWHRLNNEKAKGLQKVQPTPKFPKLGMPDDRRETPIINTRRELENKELATLHGHAQKVYQKPDSPYYQEGRGHVRAIAEMATASDPSERKIGALGAVSNSPRFTNAGYVLGSKIMGPNYPSTAIRATQLHENLHQMFMRVEKKYDPAKRRLLGINLYNAIPSQYRKYVDDVQSTLTGGIYEGKKLEHEEKLARILNYVNSRHTRELYHDAKQNYTANERQAADTAMRRAYRALTAAAEIADEKWLEWNHIPGDEQGFNKSEGGFEYDQVGTMLNHPDPIERKMALKLTGVNAGHVSSALRDEDPRVQEAALKHPLFDSGHVSEVMRGDDRNLKTQVLGSPHCEPEHLDMAWEDPQLRPSVIGHPKLTQTQIEQLYRGSTDDDIKIALLDHPNVSSALINNVVSSGIEKIGHGIQDYTFLHALKHPHVEREHMVNALRHSHPAIHLAAIKNPNVPVEELERILVDEKTSKLLRRLATEHPALNAANG